MSPTSTRHLVTATSAAAACSLLVPHHMHGRVGLRVLPLFLLVLLLHLRVSLGARGVMRHLRRVGMNALRKKRGAFERLGALVHHAGFPPVCCPHLHTVPMPLECRICRARRQIPR